MEDGRWEMENGRWEMEDGRWEMEDVSGKFFYFLFITAFYIWFLLCVLY